MVFSWSQFGISLKHPSCIAKRKDSFCKASRSMASRRTELGKHTCIERSGPGDATPLAKQPLPKWQWIEDSAAHGEGN